MLYAIVVVFKGLLSIKRRVNVDALDLAGELLLQRLQSQQVVTMDEQVIAVRLRVKKKVQNLNAMWYKEFAKNFATQGDFGLESP